MFGLRAARPKVTIAVPTAAEKIREIRMWLEDAAGDEKRKFFLLMRAAVAVPGAPRCPVCRSYRLHCPDGHAWEIPDAE